jgi:hypothetical protein
MGLNGKILILNIDYGAALIDISPSRVMTGIEGNYCN